MFLSFLEFVYREKFLHLYSMGVRSLLNFGYTACIWHLYGDLKRFEQAGLVMCPQSRDEWCRLFQIVCRHVTYQQSITPHIYSMQNARLVSQHPQILIWTSCLKAAFSYLMQELRLHDFPRDSLTQDGQFIEKSAFNSLLPTNPMGCLMLLDGYISFNNCTYHLYVDNSQHLQVSIVRSSINHISFSIT